MGAQPLWIDPRWEGFPTFLLFQGVINSPHFVIRLANHINLITGRLLAQSLSLPRSGTMA